MIKRIFLITALLLFSGIVNAQWADVQQVAGGTEYKYTFSSIDSAAASVTGATFIDWSLIDGGDIFCASRYTSVGTTQDSLRVIIQGRYAIAPDLILNLDTFLVIGNTASSLAEGRILSLSGFADQIRLRLEPIAVNDAGTARNRANGNLALVFYAKEQDYVPDRKNYKDPYNRP